MGRYLGAKCKSCRRAGAKLYLKGERCLGDRCTLELRNFPPGPRRRRRGKTTDYGIHLREKQVMRRMFGIGERQFRNYFVHAKRIPGVTGEELVRLLERRLDNVVFRSGLADSRTQAKQLVSHRHFWVNGRVVDRPSFLVHPGDVVEVKSERRNRPYYRNLKERGLDALPADFWISLDPEQLRAEVKRLPNADEMEENFQHLLVVEYYSNRV
ncbi:MAG: 30S ribosomal protein S4 [Candidatus Riflebacteria bacterium RBG_13_59_9]|nr:MAG: 30S ribosomal protein S4 [Candidatus Riflebacteria bacterium RBG_13_59_9]